MKTCFKFLLILYINTLNVIFSQLISIPFELDVLADYKISNSTIFFNEYFKREIIIQLNIGTPPRIINSKINQDSLLFLFKKEDKLNSINDKYNTNKSHSFLENEDLKKNIISHTPGIDIFHFNESGNGADINEAMNFFSENYTSLSNDSYTPVVGLHIPINKFEPNCPNLFLELKKKNKINKLIWSLEYSLSYKGKLIIGDELSKYKPDKYKNSHYATIYLGLQYNIHFDAIYIEDRNKIIKEKFNLTDIHINFNSGFIIGPNEYKNYIDKTFFNELIDKQICTVDIMTYNYENINNLNNIDISLINKEFYFYSCYAYPFTGYNNKKDYYDEFPNLIFSSKMLEYNFVLSKSDLFHQIFNRYYFLIIFQKNFNQKEKEVWHFGEPFYKKYTFSINNDAKTIGFYIDEEKKANRINEKNDINKNDTNNNDEKKIGTKKNKFIKYIIEIIFVVIILFLGYYIGITVKERRRKRANELKDDNYEYIPENNNKKINENDSNFHKYIELNSKLGL